MSHAVGRMQVECVCDTERDDCSKGNWSRALLINKTIHYTVMCAWVKKAWQMARPRCEQTHANQKKINQ